MISPIFTIFQQTVQRPVARAFSLGLLIGAALLSVGCVPSSESSGNTATSSGRESFDKFSGEYPIQVVCTTQQVSDALRRIGGEKVEVTGLMGPDVDPHLFRALPSDNKRLAQADMVFYNGLHLEGRLADLLVQLARRKPTFAVTEGLQNSNDSRLREPEEFEGHYDPHLWHDVSLWADCVRYAADQLIEFDPDNAQRYQENTDRYVAQLMKLHEECKAKLAKIPTDRRVLVTAHDAFGYFGQAYDIEVFALQGISTVAEADFVSMNKLKDMLVSRKIKAVFPESSVPPRGVESLIEWCSSKGHPVTLGGELYSNAMGNVNTPEATYQGMIRHNVNTIIQALK